MVIELVAAACLLAGMGLAALAIGGAGSSDVQPNDGLPMGYVCRALVTWLGSMVLFLAGVALLSEGLGG